MDLDLSDRMLSPSGFNQEQIRLLSERMQPCNTVLDLCTGLGNLAKDLAYQGKTVYGLDIDEESLEYATRNVGDEGSGIFYPVQGDARNLGYNSEFDGVSCASSFDWENLDPVTAGIYRALKPGGYFAVTGIENSMKERHTALVGRDLDQRVKDGSLVFTDKDLEELGRMGELIGTDEFKSSAEKIKGSSAKVVASLERNGFQIRNVQPFYEDTAYCVLAQRD